ncbi:MAG: FAD-dependent oxidoreductase [Akkermansiaceae bacterium]|nr:FAD-dependent oxidoreductase [Akkermansiaceae bacterium]MCP5549512.1 FAD-dependent oxidoreductase [Akkermansiaceae bacterium]
MAQNPLNRREFARQLAAGAGALAGSAGLAAGQDRVNPGNRPKPAAPRRGGGNDSAPDSLPASLKGKHSPTTGALAEDGAAFHEAARDIPVRADFDVIVCGGGPAGFTAALASARSGAKTALLEVNGCVGGVWTAGMLSWIIDSKNKPGIMRELVARLETDKLGRYVESSFVYHPEPMKLALENLLLESGVTIRLHTRVVGAVADDNDRLTTVLTESKSGREAWTAKAFVDCTGDGDLAAQAGCGFEYGRPGDGVTQPMSLMTIFTGCDTDGIAAFIRGQCEPRGLGNPKSNLLAEFRRAGIEPSYGGPTIFEIRDGLYAMMVNHQYNASAINADEVSEATLQARREVHALAASLRKLGGPWAGIDLMGTAEQIGTREGRRILGRYYVKDEDLRDGATFEDGICRVTFGIDVHSTKPDETKGIESKPFKSKPYDIPLRALIARDVSGLLMAGRCISGGFIAHSSYRVTGDAVTMGEAAGVTAALSAKTRTLPHEIPFSEVSQALGEIRADAEGRVAASA